jgi:surface antigen
MAALALAVAGELAGCASLGLPFGPDLVRTFDQTSAVAVKGDGADNVAASDWDAVKKTISGLPPGQAKSVQWSNPVTGSTGAVTLLGDAAAPAAAACRPFSTTISDPRGVRRYRGQACRQTDGRWQLIGLAAEDALLS